MKKREQNKISAEDEMERADNVPRFGVVVDGEVFPLLLTTKEFEEYQKSMGYLKDEQKK